MFPSCPTTPPAMSGGSGRRPAARTPGPVRPTTAATAPPSGPWCRSRPANRRIAQGQRPHRVGHDGDRLVLGDRLQPAGHRVDRHVGARHEREREHQQRHALGRLRVAGHQPDADEQPREGEAVDHAQAEGGQAIDTSPWMRNPMAKPIAVVTARPQASSPVSASDRPASTRPRIGQRPEAVEQAVLDVLGHAGGGAGAGEQHARHHEAGDEEVDVGDAAGARWRRPKT